MGTQSYIWIELEDSDKGKFINGENIMIDGGRNAMERWV